MGKKGAAHFEMIVSFVLFTFVVTFILLSLKPYEVDSLSETILEETYISFKDYTNTNLSSLFLQVSPVDPESNPSGGRRSGDFDFESVDCRVDLPEDFFRYDPNKGSALVSEFIDSSSFLETDSFLSGDLLKLKISGQEDKNYYVLISPEFSSSEDFVCENEIDSFEVGQIVEKEVLSYSLLEKIKQEYDNDYEALKSDLDIPSVFDFAVLNDEYSDLNMVQNIPDGIDVYANEYLLEVINEDGEINNVRFVIQVW